MQGPSRTSHAVPTHETRIHHTDAAKAGAGKLPWCAEWKQRTVQHANLRLSALKDALKDRTHAQGGPTVAQYRTRVGGQPWPAGAPLRQGCPREEECSAPQPSANRHSSLCGPLTRPSGGLMRPPEKTACTPSSKDPRMPCVRRNTVSEGERGERRFRNICGQRSTHPRHVARGFCERAHGVLFRPGADGNP